MTVRAASLLGIGEFARRTGLSIKQLRSYHRVGLLVPAEIDDRTGYRRYASGQVQVAVVIARLRSVELSLADVARLLSDPSPDAVGRTLAVHREVLGARIDSARVALARLDRILQEETAMASRSADRNLWARFSDSAVGRLGRAQELAEERGLETVTPLSLLEAISYAEESTAMWLLIAAGVKPAALRERVMAASSAAEERLDLDPLFQSEVTPLETRHLLFAIVDAAGPAAELLADLGVDREVLERLQVDVGRSVVAEPPQPRGRQRMYGKEMFSDGAWAVILRAQKRAGRDGLVTPEHLAQALLADGGPGRALVGAIGGDVLLILTAMDRISAERADVEARAPSRQVTEVLHLAAQETGGGEVGEQHLLVALALSETEAGRALRSSGAVPETLRRAKEGRRAGGS
ncbi:MAG TPA: Clp protease N-terminal domain-containing protein [Candidatus Dormibacteraeota bacterium]|jgi:DNA-binding transcriptional MerR regulator|nr:Clp protease N-terminal domain-containing protein [Candidatus Dormibacteraeota bacterium]